MTDNTNTIEQLKTFEDACKIEGLDPQKVIPDFSCLPEKDRKAAVAYIKLTIISRVANRLANNGEEWTPDFTNGNERKYEPWFYRGSSGFRFYVCGNWSTRSFVGSRLCFISREVAEYVANQFIDIYNDFLS